MASARFLPHSQQSGRVRRGREVAFSCLEFPIFLEVVPIFLRSAPERGLLVISRRDRDSAVVVAAVADAAHGRAASAAEVVSPR